MATHHIPIPTSPFGMEVPDDPSLMLLKNMNLSSKDPAIMSSNIETLATLVEQLYITNRDNTAIMFQMLGSVEERINKKFDQMKIDMTKLVDTKLENFTAMHLKQLQTLQESNNNSNNKPPLPNRGKLPSNNGGMAIKRPSVVDVLPTVAEQQQTTTTTTTTPPVETIHFETIPTIPHAGFVIKTKKLLGNKDKVFINVFHHELVLLNPPNSAKSFIADNKPFCVIGEATNALDKEGHNCSTYNIVVSSEYFKLEDSEETELKIASQQAITKV
jgi:hypothetical protein